ncbi:MAG TPA: hypothetical protein VLL50_14910 [Usitatibacter sp.]|nr:hypothetical protein [Usitatibacter sp.]
MKRTLLPLAAALAFAVATPVFADEYIVRDVTIAPPAPITEEVPAPREGYVWAPGYYDYAQNKHHWHKGRWMRERRGYTYVAPRWVDENGHWNLYAENWVKDEDAKDKRGPNAPHVSG